MRTGIYYLNNSGSRWVVLPKPKVNVLTPEGFKTRTILSFESFGNFGCAVISYKGKKYKCLLEDSDGGPLINLSKQLNLI